MLWRFLGFLAMLGGSPRQNSQGGHSKNKKRGAGHDASKRRIGKSNFNGSKK
jgi:hypothetical protein